jgi:exodeoxyribonuclease V alpha subunit
VGAGEPFYQVIRSGAPAVRLSQVHRQGRDSGIVHAAHAFNRGQVPDVAAFEDIAIEVVGSNAALPARVVQRVAELVAAGVRLDAVQVLTPLNNHPWGQRALNGRLQAIYNPGPFPLQGCPFKAGDRVIHTKNVYDLRGQTVLNGMTGVVQWVAGDALERELNARCQEAGDDELPEVLQVRFDGEAEDTGYTREDLVLLQLAYAMSVHRSQGSEFEHVVLALPTTYPAFMLRQLAYTGLTRARQSCTVLSAGPALRTYVENEERVRRVTFLGDLIRQAAQGASHDHR